MRELLNSMVRLSAAVTVFGMQEVQVAIDAVNPNQPMDKLRDLLDSMASAVSSKIDEPRLPTLESFSKLGTDVIDRTMDTLGARSLSPSDIVQSTSNAVKSTSDWLEGIVKPAPSAPASAEPEAAEEALGG